MKISAKRTLTSVGSVILGAGVIFVGGKLLVTPSAPDVIAHNEPVPSGVQTNARVQTEAVHNDVVLTDTSPENVKALTVNTLSADEIHLPKGSSAQKASINDYRMLIKIEKKKAKTDNKTEKKAEEKSEQPVVAEVPDSKPARSVKSIGTEETLKRNEAFDKVYESCSTEIYDPKPEPLNLTATRSVRNEYYTVRDIISGGTVTMDAHEMLCRIVNNEIGSDWDEDAIKAQIVAAYSFLRYNDSIGLTPEVGLKADYTEKIERCVSAVEGQAVFYDNKIINAVYSASTAGYSVESERIWDVYYPYLRAVVSEYDCEDPHYGVENTFTYDEIRSIFASSFGVTLSDDYDNWFVMDDFYSGRYVGFVTIDGQKRITAREFQDALDLESEAFTVNVNDGKVVIYTFGWGHGVGMSQWGAHYYAEHGYTYDQILRHYYLNTTVALSKESSRAVERGAG